MGKHQIIYTSCMRGINGVNDGQQIYSYDEGLQNADLSSVKDLFAYQIPALDPGISMNEEIAARMPKAYTYRNLGNGRCAIAANTYLGRDYMGKSGRFGNHLSHVVLSDEEELDNYPCEYYGSKALRDHMEFEEVNNPEPPAFLPEPELARGTFVNIDVVVDFLSLGNHMEIYKDMVYAMLAFESQRKRVVICDRQENIILWIAAMEYALPLPVAKTINFTTYEYAPSLSASRICGVVSKGTKFTEENEQEHFVFDMEKECCATFQKEREETFFSFIDMAMSYSYESLQDFHRFLTEGFSYDKADEHLFTAYDLYEAMADGFSSMAQERIERALTFADKFAKDRAVGKIIQRVLSEKEQLSGIPAGSFLYLAAYILKHIHKLTAEERETFSNLLVERTLALFSLSRTNEKGFVKFYQYLERLCRDAGLNLSAEFMKTENASRLFSVLQQDASQWEIAFIVKVISEYVIAKRITVEELLPGQTVGDIYCGIVRSVYSNSEKNGFYLVTKILDSFGTSGEYLVNMALNIEGILLDLPNGEKASHAMWQYFLQKMSGASSGDYKEAYSLFERYERFEQLFLLYSAELKQCGSIAECERIWENHVCGFLQKNRSYAENYEERVLNTYFLKLQELEDEGINEQYRRLFDFIRKHHIKLEGVSFLVERMMENIPMRSPDKTERNLIPLAIDYTYNFCKETVSGRLLLLTIGMILEKTSDSSQFREKLFQLKQLIKDGRATLVCLESNEKKDYLDWILASICEKCGTDKELEDVFGLFQLSPKEESYFFSKGAKWYLKRGKTEKDYSVFCMFLAFAANCSSPGSQREIGKELRKLGKQKWELLDETVYDYFGKEQAMLDFWEELNEETEGVSVLNHFSRWFRKK